MDGIYCEHCHWGAALNATGILSLRRPAIGWTNDEDDLRPDPDAFFQRHLYLGVYPTAPYPTNNHCITPSPWADEQYGDYGPLLDAMRGKKWVLTPHAVTVAGNAAKVNLFEVPGGYAMPVMFAGKAASVKVTLHGLSGIADETVCEAIHAGRPRRASIAMIRSGADVVLNVPVERGSRWSASRPNLQNANQRRQLFRRPGRSWDKRQDSGGRNNTMRTALAIAGVVLFFISSACLCAGAVKIVDDGLHLASPYFDVRVSLQQPGFSSLILDGLGQGKIGPNALREPANTQAVYCVTRGKADATGGGRLWIEYRRQGTAADARPGWRLEAGDHEFRLISQWSEAEKPIALLLNFDAERCHATLLGLMNNDRTVNLPAVLHLPNQGSLRITATGPAAARPGLRRPSRRPGRRQLRQGDLSRRHRWPSRASSIAARSRRSIRPWASTTRTRD